ncbi:hypothetical protein OEA41_002248 [Lepraria neglecta]|uniref:Uncharacterized protein n=1 Tax=Lepraria neglecta TaxID=209136 RepID=A0AAD9ZER4_9LECA|nr:hypothetical protein OEA41_002248 [Lepraria neglecta]
MDGLMDPHVFARFQQVLVIADFRFTAEESYIYIDDDLKVHYFPASVERIEAPHPAVDSPCVRFLLISLDVEVWASYDSHLDDPDEESDMKLMGAGSERAAEIFVDSRILNSLRKLSNVQSFDFQFDIMTGTSDIYQPQPRHIEMIQDLRHFIEHRRCYVSFVLPSIQPQIVPTFRAHLECERKPCSSHPSNTRRPFDRKACKRAESAKKQADEDGRNYGESPRRYYYAGSDDGPPPRKLDHLNDEEGYRAGITYDLHLHRGP